MGKNRSYSIFGLSLFLFLFIFTHGPQSVKAAVSADKIPLVYFGLNEGSGTTTTSGGQHTVEANLSGGATWETVNLPFAQDNTGAMQFSGEDGAVKVLGSADQAKLKVDGSLTVAAWVYPTGTGGNSEAIILSKEGEYELARFDDGTLRWAIDNTNPNWLWVDTGAQLPLNEWSHVAFMYADDLDTAATYLNGVEVDRRTASGPITDHVPSQNEFWIGGRQALPRHFEGIIDEVYVYDQPLLADEIAALAAVEVAACNVIAQTRSVVGQPSGMVGYQQPEQPIPHHEPGYQAQVPNGETAVVPTADDTGRTIEAEGIYYEDPLLGNYNLVQLDNIAVARVDDGNLKTDVNRASQKIEEGEEKGNYELANPSQLTGSEDPVGQVNNSSTFDLAAGDLNGDNQDEQILAYRPGPGGAGGGPIHLKITGYPGTSGNLSSEPVAINFNGDVYLFARGYDDALWIAIDKGPILSWQRCGGTLTSGPAVAQTDESSLTIVAVGTDGNLWERAYSGGGNQDWTQLPNGLVAFESTPAVVAHADGSRDVFARGTDNAVYVNHFNGASWGSWLTLGGYAADGLGAIGFGTGKMSLLVRGFDNGLWYRTFDGSWGSWQLVEGGDFKLASAVTPLATGANSFDVYARGDDNRLGKISFNAGIPSAAGWQIEPTNESVGSRPGVMQHNGETSLYVNHVHDGRLLRLKKPVSNQNWVTMNVLAPKATEINTGLIPEDFDSAIKVITGHFRGDGREQIVLAFINSENKLELHMYEVNGGFTARLLTSFTVPKAIDAGMFHFDIASGDFDGNDGGLAELGVIVGGDRSLANGTYNLFDVHLIDIDNSIKNSPPSLNIQKTYNGDVTSNDARFHRTSLTSGDFSGDGVDELAVAFVNRDIRTNSTPGVLSIFSFDDEGSEVVPTPNVLISLFSTTVSQVEIEAGDFTGREAGIKKDEIFIAISNNVQENRVSLNVFQMNWEEDLDNEEESNWVLDELDDYSPWNFEGRHFAITAGDFNRDLKDEFALLRWQGNQEMLVFSLDSTPSGWDQVVKARRDYEPVVYTSDHMALAAGDFSGNSLRVGAPDYRLQHNVGSIVAILNAPPSHTDAVNGQEIKIAREGNGSAEVRYETTTSVTSELAVESNRSYDFETESSSTIGDPEGSHVTASIDSSYGNNFSNGFASLQNKTIKTTITAATEDRVIYNGNSYQVWEYPLYADNSNVPATYISVVFPVATSVPIPLNNKTARSCDQWYLPAHQIGNVWSYPTLGEVDRFIGYPENGSAANIIIPQQFDVADSTNNWETTLNQENSTFLESEAHFGFSTGFEAQIGGDKIDVGIDTPFGSIGGSVTTPAIKSSMKGSYSSSNLSTSKLKNGTGLKISSEYIGDFPAGENFTLRSFLYNSQGGYIVLDHTADPATNQGVWLNYNKPDPTFNRPWAFDALCGADKIDYSPEITFAPEYVSPGETVEISAKVHNYSNEIANNVEVDFYAGDPDNGGILIGRDSIAQLSRQAGPQEVSMTWEAFGSGETRIYVVIDSENKIAEVHDEVSNVNNNKGYNTIRLAASDFVDMGLPQTYYPLEFGTTANATRAMTADELSYSAHIAIKGLEETQQFELTAVKQEEAPPAGLRMIGKPIALQAYSAGLLDDVDLAPDAGDAPSVLKVGYGSSEIDEQVVLRRWSGSEWADAGCAGRQVEQITEANLFVAPVCETGRYALFTTDASGPAVATVVSTTVNEDGKTATVQVQLSKPAVGNESVDYSTSNGSAEAGSDYGSATGTVSFAAGETSKSITISLLDDTTAEGSETFSVALQNPLNLILGASNTATVTILDDDGTVQKVNKIFLPLINH
ncbi:MAG: LamG-like jellyroll fold domain-containing protein [Anaerolineae bacterium]